MVVDVESQAASVTEGNKAAHACDMCTRRSRASWYCQANDAFLCQSCDTSIHSTNHLTKRKERIRLHSSLERKKTTFVRYEGFRRKTRTPRNRILSFEKSLQITSNDTLVLELGGEEDDDVFYSLSSTDENDESLDYCVPVFNPSSEMLIDEDVNNFGLVLAGVNNSTNREKFEELERAVMEDEGLIGFMPLDTDLGELKMDVESLLEEEQLCMGGKEPNSIGLFKEEINIGFMNCKELKRVKDYEKEEAICENEVPRESNREASKDVDERMSLYLRLNYKAVISAWGHHHGSPWKPESNQSLIFQLLSRLFGMSSHIFLSL